MKRWLVVAAALCCAPRLAGAAEAAARTQRARVFDLATAQHSGGLGIARTWARKTSSERRRPGYELRGVDVLRWTHGVAVVEGWFGASLRWGPGHLSGSILQNGGLAGVHWGPLDLKAGVSSSLLSVGLSSGDFALGAFWPRATLGVGLQLGPARLEALAHVEYAWGWLGPDEYVRGLGLVLSLPRQQVGPAFREPAPAE